VFSIGVIIEGVEDWPGKFPGDSQCNINRKVDNGYYSL
jgi:hypothetical protein